MTITRLGSTRFALTAEERAPRCFPSFRTLSAAFICSFVPLPDEKLAPEYVTVPVRGVEERLFVSEWNTMWEAGYLRSMRDEAALPPAFEWLSRFQGHNVYLLPGGDAEVYHRFAVLYHLLPLSVLRRFGLPPLHRGIWPFTLDTMHDVGFPADLQRRLERAWSYHIWPLLAGGRLGDKRNYSHDDPLRLLSHGLEYWLPHAYAMIENLVPDLFERVPLDTDELRARYEEIRSSPEAEGLDFARPRMGGYLWSGEGEAREITAAIVNAADADGRLRAVIDAIQTNRQEDDFSDRWSNAKVDFERAFHHTRAKTKIVFVEVPGTIPVQGPHAEINCAPVAGASDTAAEAVTDVVWEQLMSLVDAKARRIVVLLRSGETRVGEISKILGYANHAPVSKRLRAIRELAHRYLDEGSDAPGPRAS
jgi:hypothetical protein